MPRKVFFSFHYAPDSWRASKVRQMGVIEGDQPLSDNDWETVTSGGDAAIKRWIDSQLTGKSCAIVLIGSSTADRKWINYEIESAWNAGKGLLGIHIHNLKDRVETQSAKGSNPFAKFTGGSGSSTRSLSSLVNVYDPPFAESTMVYGHIKANIESWVEAAIRVRT